MKKSLCIVFLALSTMAAPAAIAQPVQPVADQAKVQKEPFLATLKQLVDIESGSYDRDGLDRIAEVVASKLRGLGGRVAGRLRGGKLCAAVVDCRRGVSGGRCLLPVDGRVGPRRGGGSGCRGWRLTPNTTIKNSHPTIEIG